MFILRTYIFIVQKIAVWFGSTPIVVVRALALAFRVKYTMRDKESSRYDNWVNLLNTTKHNKTKYPAKSTLMMTRVPFTRSADPTPYLILTLRQLGPDVWRHYLGASSADTP